MSSSIFQDLPLIDRNTRLNVMELCQSEKQLVNEIVYRFCKFITRTKEASVSSNEVLQSNRKILILDFIGAINPVRMATVLKRDQRRLRLIGVARGCKINSTYVTLNSYLGRQGYSTNNHLKLLVIYHDEHFILKTLMLINQFLLTNKCQVLFIVPKLDRQEQEFLTLHSKYQNLKCDFIVNRRAIGPAPPEHTNESYQSYLNQVQISRFPSNKYLPDKVKGELKLTGLHIFHPNDSVKSSSKHYDLGSVTSIQTVKKLKSDSQDTMKELI